MCNVCVAIGNYLSKGFACMALCDYVDAIPEKVNMLSLWDFFGKNLKIK